MTGSTFVRGVCLVAGLFLLVFGIWALAAPKSFFDQIAQYPPYNRHLFHDIGSFQMGIGAALLGALVWTDGVFIALFGAAVGSVAHEYSHIVDRDLGGKSTDPIFIGIVAVLLVAAAIARKKEVRL
jgi:drug/metabolite transporter (DMT)-like permease